MSFDSYWNDPDATEKSLKAGWYHTGDLNAARPQEMNSGSYPARRTSSFAAGTNISPAEVEEALVACHPAVEEAAVVGVPDAVLGQRVFGFVKLVNRMKDTIVSRNSPQRRDATCIL